LRMFLTGLGTATPPNHFTQREGWDALAASGLLPTLTTRSQAILRKILLGDNGICGRYLALDSLLDAFEMSPDVLDARFARHAPAVAARAAERAMARADIAPRDVDALVISTCTGYLCPGLSSYVSERLGLSQDVLLLDLVGQGCGAALPNMRAGEALIAAGRARKVLSVCVEICSAAMYMDDDPGVLVSACLFGDGAGAAVLSAEPDSPQRRIEWKTAGTRLAPDDRDLLRFEKRGGMLRNILSPEVPALAGVHAERILGDDGEPVHVCTIERRHVNRGDDVGGEHTAKRRIESDCFDTAWGEVDSRAESPLRFVAIEDMKELLLITHTATPPRRSQPHILRCPDRRSRTRRRAWSRRAAMRRQPTAVRRARSRDARARSRVVRSAS